VGWSFVPQSLSRPSAPGALEIARLIDAGKSGPVIEAAYPFAATRKTEEWKEHGHVRARSCSKWRLENHPLPP
jgi:hypothetical protein